jgi:hypothetical protein
MAAQHVECGNAVNLTASSTISGANVPAILLGFYVNSTTSGTIIIKDGGTSGTALSGTITPAVGFHRFPCTGKTDLYATIGATINVTFFWQPQ